MLYAILVCYFALYLHYTLYLYVIILYVICYTICYALYISLYYLLYYLLYAIHFLPYSIVILETMNVSDLTLMHTKVLDEPKQRKIHLIPRDLL